MKAKRGFIVALMILVSGWAVPTAPSIVADGVTPAPTQIPLPTKTLISTVSAPTLAPSPTPRVETYPVKEVLLTYVDGIGEHSRFDGVNIPYQRPRLMLYQDGQLLIEDQKGYMWEKQLTEDEIEALVDKLRGLGLFDLETNQQDDPSDPLYHFGPGEYQKTYDAPFTRITVNGDEPLSISIYEPLKGFVVQPAKDILDYLDHYSPSGLTPYQPDRLLILIEKGRKDWVDPNIAAIPWPVEVPLPQKHEVDRILFFGGNEARILYQLMDSNRAVFTWGGEEYSIVVMPILPDQCPKQVYSLEATLDWLPFVCEE